MTAKRNIILSDEIYSRLKKHAEHKSVPVISIIREACEEYVVNHASDIGPAEGFVDKEDYIIALKRLQRLNEQVFRLTGECPDDMGDIEERLAALDCDSK